MSGAARYRFKITGDDVKVIAYQRGSGGGFAVIGFVETTKGSLRATLDSKEAQAKLHLPAATPVITELNSASKVVKGRA